MVFEFLRKTKGRIRRPSDVVREQSTFDICSSELSSMSVIQQREPIKLAHHSNYNGGQPVYDVVYRSDGNCLYSLYRTHDKADALAKFACLSEVLGVLHKELCLSSRTCFTNARNLEMAVQFILKYRNWLPIHFAARFGLANFFRLSQHSASIKTYLDTPSKPLERTPLMLGILSNDLDTIKAILSMSPTINLHDRRGNNVLHFAAICPLNVWSPVFRYCLARGHAYELLAKKNNKLVTPVHFLCYSKNFENIVELLKIGLTVELLTIEPPYIIRRKARQNEGKPDKKGSKDEEDRKRIVQFTEEMIADLKFEDMIYGGTPLHWCQYKRTLERLIEYEFDVNAYDLNKETAITKCIQDNRLKCLVMLLNAGANPNLTNKKGNTSLHEAVLSRDVAAVQACICWDAHLDQVNKAGETARHLAATRGGPDDQLIVHVLHSVGAARCNRKMQNCRPDCSFSGLTNGKKYAKWPTFEREAPYLPFLNQSIVDRKLQELVESNNKQHPNGDQNGGQRTAETKETKKADKIRMICFDGGGTKGLLSVQVLIEIEKRLKRPINDYFEWMAGTSTGSIITAMLSLNIPLRNIKVIYYMLKDKIMVGPRPYDSGLLECLLQGILGEDVKMGQIEKKILITGTLADRTPCQLHLFRSYPSANEILNLRRQSVERLLNCKKGVIHTKNLDKMRNLDPHGLIIELSNLLAGVQRPSPFSSSAPEKRARSNSFDASVDLKELPLMKSLRLATQKSKTRSLSKLLHSSTTLSEFTESPNEIHRHGEPLSSSRLKFFHIPNYLNQKLWLACRSSGAAPTFFRASGPFIDGGIIANNPVLDSLTDFVNYNCALRQRGLDCLTGELDLVLSIGTGRPPVTPTEMIDIGKLFSLNFLEPYQSAVQAFNLAQEMVTMVTQTDAHVVQRAQAWCNSMQVAYFRLNPPLSENLQLNEIEEVEIVNALWETKAYMHNQRSFIEQLAKLLERPSVISI